jgi:ABC-2 type transport system permease protein
VAMLVQFVFNMGIGLSMAPLGSLYPDMAKLQRLASQMYRFVTPVIYSILAVPVMWNGLPLRRLYTLNPLVGVLGVYHSMFFTPGKGLVSFSFVLGALGIAAAISGLTLVVGWWLFMRLESEVLKELA